MPFYPLNAIVIFYYLALPITLNESAITTTNYKLLVIIMMLIETNYARSIAPG